MKNQDQTRKRVGWHLLVPFLLMAAASGTPTQAEEPSSETAEAEVKSLVEKVTELREAKNALAVGELLDQIVEVHNRLESESLQHDLQQITAKVLKDRKMGDTREAAARALGRLEDEPECAYKHLKRYLPTPKTKEADTLQLAAIAAVGGLRPKAAIPKLVELMTKAKDAEVAAAAITALGGYGHVKKRTMILKEMISTMKRSRPHYTKGKRVGQATRQRWRVIGGPLIRSANLLTGQRLRDAEEWTILYDENKRRLKDLFIDES